MYEYAIIPFLSGMNVVKATVVHMEDPDSLIVRVEGKYQRVQLIGVDAPELVGPRKNIKQCYSGEALKGASEYLKTDRTVELEIDEAVGDTDDAGRLLRYVRLPDGTNLNSKLIEDGFAKHWNNPGVKYNDNFSESEKIARMELRGLWSVGSCAGKF